MMEGGPSHIDTFDPKPELAKKHLQKFKRNGERRVPCLPESDIS